MYHKPLIIGAIFVLSLTFLPVKSYGQDDGPARKLVNSQGCKACHTLEGDGGKLASSFGDIRARLSRPEVRLQLVNQAGRHGKKTIPDFSHLSEEEIDVLVHFIQPEP